jgi:hypothetical protein
MSNRIIRTPKRLKSPQKSALLERAEQLNGSVKTHKSMRVLHQFAEEDLGISISNKVMRNIINRQADNGSGPDCPPRCRKRSSRFTACVAF